MNTNPVSFPCDTVPVFSERPRWNQVDIFCSKYFSNCLFWCGTWTQGLAGVHAPSLNNILSTVCLYTSFQPLVIPSRAISRVPAGAHHSWLGSHGPEQAQPHQTSSTVYQTPVASFCLVLKQGLRKPRLASNSVVKGCSREGLELLILFLLPSKTRRFGPPSIN